MQEKGRDPWPALSDSIAAIGSDGGHTSGRAGRGTADVALHASTEAKVGIAVIHEAFCTVSITDRCVVGAIGGCISAIVLQACQHQIGIGCTLTEAVELVDSQVVGDLGPSGAIVGCIIDPAVVAYIEATIEGRTLIHVLVGMDGHCAVGAGIAGKVTTDPVARDRPRDASIDACSLVCSSGSNCKLPLTGND